MNMTREERLRRALAKEDEEKSFYLQAASGARNVFAKRIFEELALEEDLHEKRVLEIFEGLKKDEAFKKWITTVRGPSKLEELFHTISTEKAERCEDDICALKTGLEMEEKSVVHYETLAQAAENIYEKRLYLTLAYEERGHYLRVMDAIEYLSDPVGWHYIHQRSMVDGG